MKLEESLRKELERLTEAETFKDETLIASAQGAVVRVEDHEVLMLASNNYLGLAGHPKITEAAIEGIRQYGYGMASVRFICGTLTIHRELEERLAEFLGTEDSLLFSSCYAANEAFFASISNEDLGVDDYRDVIYSDQLNHASIIDATRLCRAERVDKKIYRHAAAIDLQEMMQEDAHRGYRFGFVATDGVFSMEGDMAPLPQLVRLAEEHSRVLFVDDSHGVGVAGDSGRGTPEALGVYGKIGVLSGTLGKALGGAAGGYLAGNHDLISYLRQKGRPYVFSNSLPPPIVTATLESLRMLIRDHALVEELRENVRYFRRQIQALGFEIIEGIHPIVPIMLGEAALAREMSRSLLDERVYVKGLWYPVVPQGEARLRAQISAAHNKKQLDQALEAFERVGRRLAVI